jgi:2'-5' RNA ligase
MYLISLYFDEKTNKTLQRYIDRIAKSTGNLFMTENKVPPHMTVSAIEAKSIDELIDSFENICRKVKSGEIMFVSTGQLLPYVFYLAPVMNSYLAGMSRLIYDEYSKLEDIKISRYYQPDKWLAHVTLAKKLTKDQMMTALDVMQNEFGPFEARTARIGLSRVNPHEDVRTHILDI